MDDLQEYIEAYFKQQLSDDKKHQFEQRCIADKAFAGQVAVYITIEEGIRQKLLIQKKQQWKPEAETGNKSAEVVPVKKFRIQVWAPYLAAACLLLAIAGYYFSGKNSLQTNADCYVAEHLTLLSQTMNASKDSIQQGIAAYNNKDYGKALQIFEKLYQSDPNKINAKKYAGFVYLVTKNYDKALHQFDELAQAKDLYRNPGLFLKAVTLLQRNKQDDKKQARQILEQVAKKNLEGSREAKEWLQNR